MPVKGAGTVSDPLIPKYDAETRCNEHYVCDGSGKPLYVDITVSDGEGEALLGNADVEKVGDETPEEVWRRLGVLKEPAVEEPV